MLLELRISNFTLFDQLQLEFKPGFIVFTGETGAGKSLLVDALSLLVGGRVVGDLIRHDAEDACLEGIFSIAALPRVQAWLASSDLGIPGSDELLLRRVLSRSGRNRAYINGKVAPVVQLQELGQLLLDIHGQHEQQSLLAPSVQIQLLDAFGGLGPLRAAFEEQFTCWRELRVERDALVGQAKERMFQQEYLQHEYDELCKAELRTGEEEELLQEYRRLQNSEKLADLSHQAYSLLYETDASVCSAYKHLKNLMQELKSIDPTLSPWIDKLEEVTAMTQEMAHVFRDYRDRIEHDPARLAQIDERLALLQRLKRKYQQHDIQELIARRETLQVELSQLSCLDDRLAHLEKELLDCYTVVMEKAETLSQKRKQAATHLEQGVCKELADLKMEHSRFCVRFTRLDDEKIMQASGLDGVDYLFCANPGESLQPLSRVASGGELSRLMLAIKTVLATVDQIPVLVFDEVDTGVGGEVASVMGQRLRTLGQTHQVLCFTHLPHIASQAQQHFLVEKTITNGRTTTCISSLTPFERRNEIARMLGGERLTSTVRKAATEMLQASQKVS